MDKIADYYSSQLGKHGATARGVDWNGEESQLLRFQQLVKIFGSDESDLDGQIVADLGCGYGALYEYLVDMGFREFVYHGYDISDEMCHATSRRLSQYDGVSVRHSSQISERCDYGVASGIFSVKIEETDERWQKHIYAVLDAMNDMCEKGFSFNCLTSYSDADRVKDYLYYADPAKIFDYCKRNFSKNIALLHDYGLYEFTILVRK